MVKYMTGGHGRNLIEVVTVDAETNDFIMMGGCRKKKISDYRCYHNSWEEAYQYLYTMADNEVQSCQKKLDAAAGELDLISKLREGECTKT